MSKISQIKNEFVSFLESLEGRLTPDAQAAVQAAAAPVHAAITDAETAAIAEVETAALPSLSAAVAKVVPAELAPLVPTIFELGVAALTAGKTSANPA